MHGTPEIWVAQFGRIVSRDGGSLSLIKVEEEVIHVGYRKGESPTCQEGACVLPHLELQDLMNETISRSDPSARVVVHLLT